MKERLSRDEIEELLPWRAVGKLPPEQADLVDEALAADAGLRRSLASIEEDRAAAVVVNMETSAPGRRARDRLMQMVEAHEAARRTGFAARLLARLRAAPGSKTYVFAAAAAALLIVVQAAALTDLLVAPRGDVYRTASAPAAAAGATVLVRFADGAKIADIAAVLDRDGLSVVAGPAPGGFWTVRVGPRDAPQSRIDAAMAALRARTDLIALVLPGGR